MITHVGYALDQEVERRLNYYKNIDENEGSEKNDNDMLTTEGKLKSLTMADIEHTLPPVFQGKASD